MAFITEQWERHSSQSNKRERATAWEWRAFTVSDQQWRAARHGVAPLQRLVAMEVAMEAVALPPPPPPPLLLRWKRPPQP